MEILRILKALSDDTRLRMMYLLRNETLCVCEIEAILDSSQSNVSRHLAKLRDADLIFSEKRAQWVYYGINPETLQRCHFIKSMLDEDLPGHAVLQKDIEKLREIRQHPICSLPAPAANDSNPSD